MNRNFPHQQKQEMNTQRQQIVSPLDNSDEFMGDTDECIVHNGYQPRQQQRSVTPTLEKVSSIAQIKSQNEKMHNQSKNDRPRGSQSNSQMLQKLNQQSFSEKPQNYNTIDVNQLLQPTQQAYKQHGTFDSAQPKVYQSNQNYATQGTLLQTQQVNADPEHDKDFKRAYLKLVEKVYTDGTGANLLLTQEELGKLQAHQQFNLAEFTQRNQQLLENKQQKIKVLDEIKKQQELAECTFKPQLHSKRTPSTINQNRKFEEFLRDQQQYEEMRRKKQQDRLEKEYQMKSQDFRGVPKIDKKSERIIEQKKRQLATATGDFGQQPPQQMDAPVFDRLHNLHNEKMKQQFQRTMEHAQRLNQGMKKTRSEANFSSNRSRDRGLQLYEDAIKRKQAQEQMRKTQQKLKVDQMMAAKPPSGNKNAKYAARKFEKEFYFISHAILEEYNEAALIQNDENDEQLINIAELDMKRVNYVKLGQLLTELGYIPLNIQADSVERELLFDMWNLLRGEELNGIAVLNVKKMLLSIQGIHQGDQINDDQHQQQFQTQDSRNTARKQINIEFNELGEVLISAQDAQKIFIKFKPLYVNRVQHIGQFKRVRQYQDPCTFRPQISKTTEQLAIQRRIRMLSADRSGSIEIDGADPQKMDIVHILLHPANADQSWKESAKQMLDQRELDECTFHPQTLDYQTNTSMHASKMTSRSKTRGAEKSLELYQRYKPKRESQEKTREEIEFEKSQNECTFQPNIIQSQRGLELYQSSRFGTSQFDQNTDTSVNDPTQNIKGFQQITNRLQRGREEQERVKNMKARGTTGQNESVFNPMNFSTAPGSNKSTTASAFAKAQANQNRQEVFKTNNAVINQSHSSKNLNQSKNLRRDSDKAVRQSNQNRSSNKENIVNTTRDSNLFSQKEKSANAQPRNSRYLEQYNPAILGQHQQNQDEFEVQEDYDEQNHSPFMAQHQQQFLYNQHQIVTPKQPLLYVDVNLGPGKSERIVVHEGDTADALAEQFAMRHGLENNMKMKLAQLLDSQIAGLLEKIDEEQNSMHSDQL